MGLFDFLGGSGSSTKSVSSLSKLQQDLERALGPYLTGNIGSGATPYGGQLTAGIPDMFTSLYNQMYGMMGQDTDAIRQSLLRDMNATPAWQFDEGRTAKTWKENFAVPAMETWRQTVQPLMQEQYAGIPGGFYSRDRARGVSNAANDFYGQYVQPTYYNAWQGDVQRGFQSAEAAAGRSQGASAALQGMPGAMFQNYGPAAAMMQQLQQQPLTAQYQEFLRTSAENSPWIKYALAYLGTPTMDTAVFQGQEGALGGMLSGAGMGGLMGSMGMLGGSVGGWGGAGLGLLAGI